MDYFEQTAYWLLLGSKGAENRIKIIKILKNKPMNLNELSKKTGLNYKTVQHHIELLTEHNILKRVGNKYGGIYFISQEFNGKKELIKKMLETINSKEEK